MALKDPEATLNALNDLQTPQPLTVLRLAEPLLHSTTTDTTTDASTTVPTPSALTLDLEHYTSLFSKLRFSYLEQVTKEKFLRAIVGDPPLIVEVSENVELERRLSLVKAELQTQKQGVRALVAELEAQARQLARRWEAVELQRVALETLPAENEVLQRRVEELKRKGKEQEAEAEAAMKGMGDLEGLSMGLGGMKELMVEREEESAELEREIARLEAVTSGRLMRQVERLEAEVGPLLESAKVMRGRAEEARRRRDVKFGEEGEDELEVRGRWYRGVEKGLRERLEVEG